MISKAFIILLLTVVVGVFTGCGPSREEIKRKELDRLEAERRAQEEIRKSNDAVNEVSKKLGRKPPTLDLSLPEEKKDPPKNP